MFSTEYYYLVAGLREWTLDSDTKGFDAREIVDEILAEVSNNDRRAIGLLYAYYDCENIIACREQRGRHNPLGNLSREQVEQVLNEACYSLLPSRLAKVVELYAEKEDEERDEEVKLDANFEHALFEAYYEELAASKLFF